MINHGRLRLAECGRDRKARLRANRSARRDPNSAFTLVELLVSITIIAILAAMITGASAMAMGQARQARTEALVARLHALLSEHYDSFRHRRVELNETKLSLVGVLPNRQYLAYSRLYGTR